MSSKKEAKALPLKAALENAACFATVEEALDELRAGRMLIVTDDPDRENEGDIIMAAELVTPDTINFMIRLGRGIPCVPTTPERLAELDIPMMVKNNTAKLGTAMGETVDARANTTTGVSAYDRYETVRVFVNPLAKPTDLTRPGHMIPLRAEPGGVLKRAGHTEATVDLCRMAGLYPAGVLCEIVGDDGQMARMPALLKFAKQNKLKIITIADIIQYRRRTEKLAHRVADGVKLPTRYGTFTVYGYESTVDPNPYIALTMGDVGNGDPCLVRIHSSCLTGDLLESLRCDCGDQLHLALQRIAEEGRGMLLYIHQEGRGIGILNKLKAYALQDRGFDTVEANEQLGFKPDLRDYGIGAQILLDLGIRKLRLMTNNPSKVAGVDGYGLQIVEHVPLIAPATEHNEVYLRTKRDKMGHWLKEV